MGSSGTFLLLGERGVHPPYRRREYFHLTALIVSGFDDCKTICPLESRFACAYVLGRDERLAKFLCSPHPTPGSSYAVMEPHTYLALVGRTDGPLCIVMIFATNFVTRSLFITCRVPKDNATHRMATCLKPSCLSASYACIRQNAGVLETNKHYSPRQSRWGYPFTVSK